MFQSDESMESVKDLMYTNQVVNNNKKLVQFIPQKLKQDQKMSSQMS